LNQSSQDSKNKGEDDEMYDSEGDVVMQNAESNGNEMNGMLI
jgi:hypothetical protein